MAKNTTRKRIRHNAQSAFESMTKAQDSMALIAKDADERSDHINTNLPAIMGGLQVVQDTFEKFYEGL